ncbi:MAG: cell filamentation protein Fic [Bacteroidetes bacterium GWF2_43_63]|nr:MAG: cell filamentation protein Fic [Bacteroidetes bacterium GWE2_42_42]OFY53874.1 MAG: cell filamentation protein Fic [Bacteroidetes bacterium GWF2_43_63]HBG69835.1 cell filamentation protein Fic [Bacteroidales bacterium]HCB60968.1 cell filamentation protein Fic [Bacteroidales bacterium]HCY24524.1 cell filamentation protein Fic [Bacteroidales bacterium]
MNKKRFSINAGVFHGRTAPEQGVIAGYAAIIDTLGLELPMPSILSLICNTRKQYSTGEWNVFSSRAAFEDTLYRHLVFALKYEGLHLLFFKKLFEKLSAKDVVAILKEEPTGQYSRKIWFLYEWLMHKELPIDDLTIKNYVPLVDDSLQFALSSGSKSPRHRIINNLPGTRDFCPLIRKTAKLENYIKENISGRKSAYLKKIHKDILQRTAAFLLLKDSKASFSIEGESPKSSRAARWGRIIGQAGNNDLTKEELIRLQQAVIENARFIKLGFREQGGFVGEHDRITGEPVPDHISAKWQDVKQLINGLIASNELLLNDEIDAVLTATVIAFGFVFIHPFVDGNGRIHRYLIHHVLMRKQFSAQGLVFPVSASILNHIDDYRKALESHSQPLLDFIEWKETSDHNIEVLNDTIDYYRYFDATRLAEFLYDCVNDTIQNIIPAELKYIQQYDELKRYIENKFEMPDKLIATLVRFLEQNNGKLSQRAREKEFEALTETEVRDIEKIYLEIFR